MYPSLYIDFLSQGQITPALQCTRSGVANYFNNNGKLVAAAANTPRISFNGLLIEPSATNLFPNSRDLSVFTKTGTGTIVNAVSLDNTLKPIRVNAMSSGGTVTLSYTLSLTGVHTVSFWAQESAGGYLTATFGSTTITIQGIGKRYTITATSPSALEFNMYNSGTVFSTDYFQIDCIQIENSSYVTSPIHTNGSSVTRNADIVFININQAALNNWFTATSGIMLVDVETVDLYNEVGVLQLINSSGSGATDYMTLGLKRVSSTQVMCGYNNNNAYDFFGSCDAPGQQFRIGTSFIDDEQYVSLVGRTPTAGTALAQSIDFSDIDRLLIGHKSGGTNVMNGLIKRIAFYANFVEQYDLNNLTNV